MRLVSESDALHARVRAFARGEPGDTFDSLALDIARFQARWSPGFERLVAAHGGFTSVDEIPAVPSDAFRLARVAVHAPELDVARFVTSGTTGSERGVHAFRRLDTYDELSVAFGRGALLEPGAGPCLVLALAPDPGEPGESSLGHMMRLFMRRFDARPRDAWLLDASGLRLSALQAAIERAHAEGQRVLLLAASFALVALLDALGGRQLAAPAGSRVMQTGGFKGRSRELDPAALRADVARALAVSPDRVVGEYGMTELTSQLYELEPGLFAPPPWLRVTPVDPITLREVRPGEGGLARFVDLGNVDSAIAVLTQDLVRRRGAGVELLGRSPGAPERGCSLAVEGLLGVWPHPSQQTA